MISPHSSGDHNRGASATGQNGSSTDRWKNSRPSEKRSWSSMRKEGRKYNVFMDLFSEPFGHTLNIAVCLPVGHLAGIHRAAVSGAVGPFDVAKCSPDAADGEEPHEPRPRYSAPTEKHKR